MENKESPHAGMPVRTAGTSPETAAGAMILMHGRGANALDILMLAEEFDRPELHYIAPDAHNNTWYPFSFLAPIQNNQPGIDSGLAVIDGIITQLQLSGIPPEKTVIGGFSQGACLALTYAASHPQKFGGIVALSGGLIGPPGNVFNFPGSLSKTPVFMGCSDVDFHIPAERVRESAAIFEKMGAEVTLRLYPGMGHTVNFDEIRQTQSLIDAMIGQNK